ncbi:4-oxalocrotonate tautomerase DmpI [Desulfovibrio litoralis]|uniref:4-oxalocrotonate tautomerase n=1 Tax=Desulfovibrio litoralis DSM 11393 TaxID=1121455 RepID=A0A1M7SCM7_9BACT|nr:4-oxalocrotonate tautomerase DmpI [Desulfovibrio litoralis]SHN56253.1 4-oxalocrotonate tautomerase [Desulfovibrio litoralis DSM 11393]
MPYITIESGSLTKEQKSKLIEEITQVASKITQIPSEFFFVTIKELPDENIGINGKTIDKTKQEYQQNQIKK